MSENRGVGRPKKEIPRQEFEKLCAIQCTKMEICDWFNVDDMTLDRWIRDTYGEKAKFSEIFRQKRSTGKISLRRNQFQLSEKNVAMAIWLGKQWLDQRDQVHSVNENIEIKLKYDESSDD